MRWFQVVVALLGGVLCEGVHVLLYVLRGMPYSEPRGYTLPTPLAVDLGMFAPVVVIAVLAVFLWLVGARWRRSLGGAFVAYIGGVCTYQFTRSLNPFFSIGSDSVFQNYEVQVITLIVGGVILCGGLVARNPSYSWRTAPVLLSACLLGYIALVNGLRFVSFELTGWFYPAVYISTCTVYGIILVMAWREPVYDDLGEGDYTLGSGGEAPAYAGEAPAYAPDRRSK